MFIAKDLFIDIVANGIDMLKAPTQARVKRTSIKMF